MRTGFFVLGIFSCLWGWTQDLQDIRTRYPGEDLVMLSNKSHYRIRIVKDSPVVEFHNEEDWMYLTEKSSMMKKEGWISHSGFYELGAYQAYTLTPKGRKLDATEFKTTANTQEGIFYDDSKLTSFKFPGLTEGSVTHQEYNMSFRNPALLIPHYFSRGLPTLRNELKITFPKTVRIRYVARGAEKDRIKFREEHKRDETTYIFSVENMPRENNYPDAPAQAYWAAHVIFFIEKFQTSDGKWQNLLSSPDDLYALYAGYVKNINKTISPELTRITDSLAATEKSPEAKAAAIYKWVQQHIKYVAFEQGMEGFVPREASLVCSRRFGDCKDFSSIITMMLRHAGLKAYYTWIGTRSIPYTYQEIPTPLVDNHMISTLELDGKLIFLDGTDPTCVFGIPSDHIQGKEALIGLDEKNFRIAEVPTQPSSSNVLNDTTFIQFTQTGIRGRIHQVLHGYYAMDFNARLRYKQGEDLDDHLREWLGRGSNKFRILSYRITDSTADGIQMGLTAEFEIPDYGKSVGSDKFINLNLQKLYEHQEIDYPKRKIPVSNKFGYEIRLVSILDIPTGFKPDYIPQAKSFENETWGFTISYSELPGKISLQQHYRNRHLLIQPDRFESYNRVLEALLPQYKESVSLTKE